MKLIRFTAEKYRSLVRKCDVAISQMTTIVGPNNEGKSNILRGIVTAVKALEVVASELSILQKKGDALFLRNRWTLRGLYDWDQDYPMSSRKTHRAITKSSVFVLYFELSQAEVGEMSRITGSHFKKSTISVRLEFSKDGMLFKMNLKGVFNKKATIQKMVSLARFITSKIHVCYIDAVRTSDTALGSIANLIGVQVRDRLYETPEYAKILDEIKNKRQEILDEIADDVNRSLKMFLPAIKDMKIQSRDSVKRVYMRSDAESPVVNIDDGELTSLAQKGSGVQSLVAIAMARYVAQQRSNPDTCFVLAIEEPESHLHPGAIHRVKNILKTISESTPVIITTHSPILVNVDDITSNIIVNNHTASSAESLNELKQLLGVWRSDNLTHANVVVIVEGMSDQRILRHLLCLASGKIQKAFEKGVLAVWNAQGCSQMMPLVRVLENEMGRYHIILDDDVSGRKEYETLVKKNAIAPRYVTMVRGLDGQEQSEIEDIFVENFTYQEVLKSYSIADVSVLPKSLRRRKWSYKIKVLYEKAGGVWGADIEDKVKTLVADAVLKTSDLSIVNPSGITIIKAVCMSIENLLDSTGFVAEGI